MTSPRRSPMRHPENPTPPPSPPEKTSSRPQTPAREDGHVPSPLRSPKQKTPPPSPQHAAPDQPATSALAITIANRMYREDAPAVAKVVGGGGGGGGVRTGERGFQVALESMRHRGMRKAALWLRVAALLLCMISFSVMAADKTEGWAGDSFDRYKEFRYLVAVNVIAFVYSAFQVYVRIHRRITSKYIMDRSTRCYFDLSMDQILAYLLMSASSSAASRNDVWVSTFGSDPFTRKANASIAISFLAFVVLALSSLISTYKLFTMFSVL